MRAQAATDQLHALIGQHRNEQVAVDPRLGAVVDRAQAQFGFQGAEHGLQVGEQGVGPPQALGVPGQFMGAQTVDPGVGEHGPSDRLVFPADRRSELTRGIRIDLNVVVLAHPVTL